MVTSASLLFISYCLLTNTNTGGAAVGRISWVDACGLVDSRRTRGRPGQHKCAEPLLSVQFLPGYKCPGAEPVGEQRTDGRMAAEGQTEHLPRETVSRFQRKRVNWRVLL